MNDVLLLKSSLLFQAAISIASGGDQVFFICPKSLEYRPYHVEGMPEFSPLVLQCVKMIYIEKPSDLLLYLCEFHTKESFPAAIMIDDIQYYVSHLSQEQSKEAAMVKLFAMLEDTVAFINQKNLRISERCRRPIKKFNSKKGIYQVLLDPDRWLMSNRSSTTNQTTVCYKGVDKDAIFFGDLNAKHPSWRCTVSNTRKYDLLNGADDKALISFNDDSPTQASFSYITSEALDVSLVSPGLFPHCDWTVLFGLAIHQNDHQLRRRFVEWAQNEIAVVPDFHKRILFSDEAHFWLNGYVNKQNCRIWSEANPQVYVETPLHPEKLTVWCALWAGGNIGPYFFKNDEGHNVTVNGDRYRAMITNFFIPELNNHDVQELWFQQDGATCHTARATIDLLKDTFGDRLISRFGPVNWPPRFCDLTPLDYFL
ncbi:hypothetical protein TNCV_3743821 [Trichonephila clavipes]|nr:hypothetical protein TNCV_3743821 [Trichonephila clavipes]